MKNSPEISGELEKGRRQSDAALTHAIKQGTGAGLRRITENAPERFPFQGVTGTSKASVRRSTCAVQLTASSSIQTVLSAPESHRIVRRQVLGCLKAAAGNPVSARGLEAFLLKDQTECLIPPVGNFTPP